MDIVFLAYKSYILKLYADEYETGIYKVDTIEEQARKEYEAHEEEKRKAVESVVFAEPMDGVPLLGGKVDE